MKKLDIAIAVIDGRMKFHPSLTQQHDPEDLWEQNYRALCADNEHAPDARELDSIRKEIKTD